MKKNSDNETIIGFHPIIEALNAGKSFSKIYIKKGLRGDLYQECFAQIRTHKIPFQQVPIERLNRITRANHQGIIGITSPIPYYEISQILPGLYEKGKDPFVLILDGITDVRNFGAIARTAESAGVDAIIIGAKKAAMINSEAIKTSAGALHRIPVCREDNLEITIKYLVESGVTLYGASEKAGDYYYNIDSHGPIGIIMGAEDTGISSSIIKQINSLIKIPMVGKITSLNVSVACGIILFEVLRQKNVSLP